MSLETSATALNKSIEECRFAKRKYVAGAIAWNDNQRGVVKSLNGKAVLSELGGNITDVWISTKQHDTCQFVRTDNLDETIGIVDASKIFVVDDKKANITLDNVLRNVKKHCDYRDIPSIELNLPPEPLKVVVRFQSSFVPLKAGQQECEILPTHYSYQTLDKSNPRNLLLLCTPKGIMVDTDGPGAHNLYGHIVADDSTVKTYSFVAEPNKDCGVGEQVCFERLAPGSQKTTAVNMGIMGMGPRTNCFVTVSIPNSQKQDPPGEWGGLYRSLSDDTPDGSVYRSLSAPIGNSHSARVSLSKDPEGVAPPIDVGISRPENEPIVVTVLTYNTTQVPEDFEGVPTAVEVATEDVGAAIRDLDAQYDFVEKAGGQVCKLSELPGMLRKLTVQDVEQIKKKVKFQPPSSHPPPMVPSSSALERALGGDM